MRSPARPLAALGIVLLLAACSASPAAPSAGAKSPAASVAHPAASAAKTAKPTAGASASPSGAPTPAAVPTPAASLGTTKTPWGRILDSVPAEFPVFPDATVTDPPGKGAVSGAWTSPASADEVATWYRDALLAANWAKVDDGGALEDGTHVLDVQGDLPECKAQVTVKPAGGSTMITVLFGAGCVGGGDG